MTDDDIRIEDHPELGRYVLTVDGRDAGVMTYHDASGRRVVEHTEIDPAFEGRGLGSRLARHVLDDIRSQGLRVVPRCPFLASFLDRHPELRDDVERDPG